jgi:hypothetical protein
VDPTLGPRGIQIVFPDNSFMTLTAGCESIIEDSLDPRPHFNLDNLDRQNLASFSPGNVSSIEDHELHGSFGGEIVIAPADHPAEVVLDDEAEESLASFVRKEREFEREEMEISSSSDGFEHQVSVL